MEQTGSLKWAGSPRQTVLHPASNGSYTAEPARLAGLHMIIWCQLPITNKQHGCQEVAADNGM